MLACREAVETPSGQSVSLEARMRDGEKADKIALPSTGSDLLRAAGKVAGASSDVPVTAALSVSVESGPMVKESLETPIVTAQPDDDPSSGKGPVAVSTGGTSAPGPPGGVGVAGTSLSSAAPGPGDDPTPALPAQSSVAGLLSLASMLPSSVSIVPLARAEPGESAPSRLDASFRSEVVLS